eukprot:COSAG01_NODE_2497_length_7572_cov_3.992908_3_plen_503_part_00
MTMLLLQGALLLPLFLGATKGTHQSGRPVAIFESVAEVGRSRNTTAAAVGCGMGAAGGGVKCTNHFWFPGSSFRTGIGNNLLQFVQNAGDGAPCGQWSGNVVGPAAASCSQVYASSDGARSWKLVRSIDYGWSGGYPSIPGVLGELLPPLDADGGAGAGGSEGRFCTLANAIMGEGAAPGSGEYKYPLLRPVLLDWIDEGAGQIKLLGNRSVEFTDVPAAFDAPTPSCSMPMDKNMHCGGMQKGHILRLKSGKLLAAFDGMAMDAPNCTSQEEKGWSRCYTISLFQSALDPAHVEDTTWKYVGRIDNTPHMPSTVEGPSEPSIVQLVDGRIMAIFREQGVSPRPMWLTFSATEGASWSPPVETPAWAVWPQLLVTQGGSVVLASGRPGVGLWILPPDVGTDNSSGGTWQYYNVLTAHNQLVGDATMQYDRIVEKINNVSDGGYNGTVGPETTSYCAMSEVEPNVVVVTYDRLAAGWNGPPGPYGAVDAVFAIRVKINASDSR